MTNKQLTVRLLGILVLSILISGCGSDGRDARYAELARESLDQQSRQNQALAAHTQQIADASRQLVEADAKARHELSAMHKQLQTGMQSERQRVDQQRDKLELERRDIARQRHREPILAAVITQAALLIAAAVPLVYGIYLFRAVKTEDPDAALGELLIGEFSAQQPTLIHDAWARPLALPAPEPLRLQESADTESSTADPDDEPDACVTTGTEHHATEDHATEDHGTDH